VSAMPISQPTPAHPGHPVTCCRMLFSPPHPPCLHVCARSTVVLRRDAFDVREADFYEALYTQSQAQFNTYVASGVLLQNYAHGGALIQMCDCLSSLYRSAGGTP
jgi:hypothetical protein